MSDIPQTSAKVNVPPESLSARSEETTQADQTKANILSLPELAPHVVRDFQGWMTFVDKFVEAGGAKYDVESSSLAGLKGLNEQLKPDPNTFHRMIVRSSQGTLHSYQISDWLNEGDSSRREQLIKQINDTQSGLPIDRARLEVMEDLTLKLDGKKDALKLLSSLNILQAEEVQEFFRSRPNAADFFDRFSASDPLPEQTDSHRLTQLHDTDKFLGSDPITTKQLVRLDRISFDSNEPYRLIDYLQETNNADKTRAIKAMIDEGAGIALLDVPRLRALDELTDKFGIDSQLVKDIAAIPPGRVDLPELSQYILEDRANEKLVSAMLESQITSKLSPYILEPYKGVIRELGLRREDVKQLSALESGGLDLADLHDYLKSANDTKKDLVFEKFRDGASSAELSPARLRAIDTINEIYGDDSFESHRLLSMRKADLASIASHIENDDAGKLAVTKLLDAGAPRSFFGPTQLQTFKLLDKTLDLTDEETSKIVGFGAQSMNVLAALPYNITVENASRVRELLATASKPTELLPERLLQLDKIEQRYGRNSKMFEDIMKLEKKGLALSNVTFWNEIQGDNPFFDNLIKSGAPVSQLEYKRAVAVDQLTSIFEREPKTMQRLLNLETQGLNLQEVRGALASGLYTSGDLVQMIEDPATTAATLNTDRVKGIIRIKHMFGSDSDVTNKIMESEKSGSSLADIGDFAFSNLPNDASTRLIKQIMAEEPSPE